MFMYSDTTIQRHRDFLLPQQESLLLHCGDESRFSYSRLISLCQHSSGVAPRTLFVDSTRHLADYQPAVPTDGLQPGTKSLKINNQPLPLQTSTEADYLSHLVPTPKTEATTLSAHHLPLRPPYPTSRSISPLIPLRLVHHIPLLLSLQPHREPVESSRPISRHRGTVPSQCRRT